MLISYYSTALTLQTQDVQLLCHFVGNATSLRSHDQNWVPICLPIFNSTAFLQAYVCNMKIKDNNKMIPIFLVLISTTSDSSTFKGLHEGRITLEEEISNKVIASRLVNSMEYQGASIAKHLTLSMSLHFMFHYHNNSKKLAKDIVIEEHQQFPSQIVQSEFEAPIRSIDSQERFVCLVFCIQLFHFIFMN